MRTCSIFPEPPFASALRLAGRQGRSCSTWCALGGHTLTLLLLYFQGLLDTPFTRVSSVLPGLLASWFSGRSKKATAAAAVKLGRISAAWYLGKPRLV